MPRIGPPSVLRLGYRLVLLLMPIFAVGAILIGLIALGGWARERVRPQDRHAIRFVDIDCTTPPGKDREEFLTEVQYLSRLPDRIQLLDDGLAGRLATAFARHPQVEKVEKLEILPDHRVRVQLTFRRIVKK